MHVVHTGAVRRKKPVGKTAIGWDIANKLLKNSFLKFDVQFSEDLESMFKADPGLASTGNIPKP